MAHQRRDPITQDDFTAKPESWPALPLEAWQDTYATLHMWTQIVGKVRLAQSPLVNHWWEVPLYISARGLTTSAIPYRRRHLRSGIRFSPSQPRHSDQCRVRDKTIPLAPRSVADFYKEFMAALAALGIEVKIWHMPVEIPNPIAFDRDTQHASYDPRIRDPVLAHPAGGGQIFQEFRSRFIGKNSPVHFFWGSFDLAVTRFSGRRAPEREGADPITREAYSHEVISAGFWPGGGEIKGPGVLRLRRPGTRRLRAEPGASRQGVLSSADERILPDVRRRSSACFAPNDAARISAKHL